MNEGLIARGLQSLPTMRTLPAFLLCLLTEVGRGFKAFDDSVPFDIQWLAHRQAPEDILRDATQARPLH